MPVKPPSKGVTSAEVHTRPSRPVTDPLARSEMTSRLPPINPRPFPDQRPDRLPTVGDMDAITAAPPLTVSEIPNAGTPAIPVPLSMADYRIRPGLLLPDPDDQGLIRLKGRLFVSTEDDHVLHVGLDPDNGLYRAKLPGELKPSGPILLQDPFSLRWFLPDDADLIGSPLPPNRLESFRTPLDFAGTSTDSEGLHGFEGKRYAVIEGHAYQVMRDIDASSPARNVWRIVNPKDPVAHDTDNVYRASRPGETLAIARDPNLGWVSSRFGLLGGMPRTPAARANVALLLQRYEPVREAFGALQASDARFNELWGVAQHLPEGSDIERAALIGLEVHTLKHIRLQAEYVQSLIDNKDWLVMMKAGGVYKTELHEQQLARIDYFNKLLAIMDRRAYPTVALMTVNALKGNLAHMSKKLQILDDRQAVMDQVRKVSRSAALEIEEINRGIPGADQINCTRYNLCLRLLSDDPNIPPPFGIRSYMAVSLIVEELHNVSGQSRPGVLQLALDEIRTEKGRFADRLPALPPIKAPYLQEAISVLGTFESRIEGQLNDIYARVDSNIEWPALDQDIDLDFVPQQPAPTAAPSAPRKIFRTRQHGAYRVLVGVKQVDPDGSVTVHVPDPFKPDAPPQRYEKRQGEWLPMRSTPPAASTPQLLGQATQLLARVDGLLDEGLAMESRKSNPTSIRESLDESADELHGLARRLENIEGVASDAQAASVIARLKAAGDSLSAAGRKIMVRMYKDKTVLDVLRLNYLLEHSELNVIKTVARKQLGKGKDKSFLDVYSINDRSANTPLWEAHFHYDRQDRRPLDYTVRGAHMKTLAQAGTGSVFQQRQEQAGLAHQPIWREYISPKVAQKLFDCANEPPVGTQVRP